MGQEWAASSPFLYFTDHNEELGRLVTEGRRSEFKTFSSFSDPEARKKIPDPQAMSTFMASRLKWDERDKDPHASVLRLYQALLNLRRTEPALDGSEESRFEVVARDEAIVLLRWDVSHRRRVLLVSKLIGSGLVSLEEPERRYGIELRPSERVEQDRVRRVVPVEGERVAAAPAQSHQQGSYDRDRRGPFGALDSRVMGHSMSPRTGTWDDAGSCPVHEQRSTSKSPVVA